MELLQLRYFQTVATLGNMSKAAEELFVSQPNLSISISRLEKELGVPLFDRRKGRIVLNRNGEQLLRCVSHALSVLDNGILSIQRQRENRPALSIAFMSKDSDLLREFVLSHPEIKITYQNMDLQELTQALVNQTIDVAWTTIIPFDDRLSYRVIYESEFVMLMSRDHPLAEAPVLTYSDLANEPFAIDPSNIHLERFFNSFRQRGVTPNINYTVQDMDLIFTLVQSGHYLTPLPEVIYEKFALQGRCRGIVRRRLDYAPIASSCIVWSKSVPLTETSLQLQDCIQQYFDDVIRRFRESTDYDPLL